jgi:hypothetical protein
VIRPDAAVVGYLRDMPRTDRETAALNVALHRLGTVECLTQKSPPTAQDQFFHTSGDRAVTGAQLERRTAYVLEANSGSTCRANG